MQLAEIKDNLAKSFSGHALFNEPLDKYNTWRVGGPADALVFPNDINELQQVLLFCREQRVPYKIMGAGSNMLVRDGGYRGIIISLEKGFRDMKMADDAEDGSPRIIVEAGASLPRVLLWSAGQGLSGLDQLTGIPGSVGGAVFMNAGTRNGDTMAWVDAIQVVNRSGRVVWISKSDLNFSYRQLKLKPGQVVVAAAFKLQRDKPEAIKARIQEGLDYRNQTQPVGQSAGCIFKNPQDDSAGRLLDKAGLKNVRVRGARVSDQHANFILNESQASARDIQVLIKLMKEEVKAKHGVVLEAEVQLIGEDIREDIGEGE